MRSMTGYSKQYFENNNYSVQFEIKTINNKNLNLKIKLPGVLNFLENKIRTEIGKNITRGSLDLKIEFTDKRKNDEFFQIDENISDSYIKVLDCLEKKYNEKITNKLEILLKNPEVIKRKSFDFEDNEIETFILNGLEEVIEKLIEMKIFEGERLKKYFLSIIENLENKVKKIKELKNLIVSNYTQKLKERLSKIEDIKFSDEDILKEILLFTDRSDISEEISRLESHIYQLKIELNSKEKSIGKKIDFILQEIFRELNTSSVKCNLYEISKIIVECKTDVEKIREQALNIE